MVRQRMIVVAALLLAAPAFAAESFEAELDPAPFDATNRAQVIGSIGTVSASLDGAVLTATGSFSGFTSPATQGSLRIGLAKGVPGDAIGTLTVTHGLSGSVSGTVTLTPQQAEALHRQALYIRIDSEKSPDGNVQGWLEGKQ